jgi:tetratricopeptide (TPR) repeat protein
MRRTVSPGGASADSGLHEPAAAEAECAALRALDANPTVAPPDPALLPQVLLDAELDHMAASAAFRSSRRHQRLLDHLVRHTVAGRTQALKESVLAAEVFDRPIATFDPLRDTIVRVEARRLRQRLERYYAGEGANSVLRIGLPVGSYVPTLRRRDAQRPAGSLHANDLVERGYHFMRQADEAGIRKALERFELALREEPEHAGAHVGAARAWLNLVSALVEPPLPWVEHATEALRHSLALDPEQPEALTLLGSVLHRYEFDWDAAQMHLKRAVELAPGRAFVHSGYGFHLLLAGRFDEAQVQLKTVRQLDPHFLSGRIHMAMLRIAQQRFDDAKRELDAVLDLAPADLPARAMSAAVLLYTGQAEQALRRYREIDADAPQHPVGMAGIAQAHAMLGDRAATDAVLAALHERFAGRYVSPYQIALIELRRGDFDAALQRLDEGAASRDPNIIYAPTDPGFKALHGHPRFETLMQRHRRPVS